MGLDSRALYGVDDPAYRGFPHADARADRVGYRHRSSRTAGRWSRTSPVTRASTRCSTRSRRRRRARRTVPPPAEGSPHTLLHAYFPNADTAARARAAGRADRYAAGLVSEDADALLPALGAPRLEHFIGIRTWLDARRARRDQHRSHVRPRSEHVAEPVQPVPDHRHGRNAADGRWSGDRRERDDHAPAGTAHDDHRSRASQLRRSAQRLDRSRASSAT